MSRRALAILGVAVAVAVVVAACGGESFVAVDGGSAGDAAAGDAGAADAGSSDGGGDGSSPGCVEPGAHLFCLDFETAVPAAFSAVVTQGATLGIEAPGRSSANGLHARTPAGPLHAYYTRDVGGFTHHVRLALDVRVDEPSTTFADLGVIVVDDATHPPNEIIVAAENGSFVFKDFEGATSQWTTKTLGAVPSPPDWARLEVTADFDFTGASPDVTASATVNGNNKQFGSVTSLTMSTPKVTRVRFGMSEATTSATSDVRIDDVVCDVTP